MWIQRDQLTKEISWNKILDWVVINGVLWVEVLNERGRQGNVNEK